MDQLTIDAAIRALMRLSDSGDNRNTSHILAGMVQLAIVIKAVGSAIEEEVRRAR